MQGIELFEKWLLNKSVPYTQAAMTPMGEALFYIYDNTKKSRMDLASITRLIAGIAHLVHDNTDSPPILIIIREAEFEEKLLYIILECYLEHIIGTHNVPVKVVYHEKTSIVTKGLLSMPMQLLKDGTEAHRNKFLKVFQNEIYLGHYRHIFEPLNSTNLDSMSVAMTDICAFLVNKGINPETADEISEVVVELAGNAVEHAKSQCLVDIDIAENYYKRNEPKRNRYDGVNICVLNFSSLLLGTQIQDKMCMNPDVILNLEGAGRYVELRKAYINHQDFFDKSYTEDDFFILSAFQHKISGRKNDNMNGGTGLPQVIKSLETKSDNHFCYLISGQRMMFFIKDLLQYNEECWIGMNEEKNFVGAKPNKNVFCASKIYFPGTAYNLNFILAKQVEEAINEPVIKAISKPENRFKN